MNDSAEMLYAVKIISEVITEYLERDYTELTKKYLTGLLRSTQENVKSDRADPFMNSAFICCFCEHPDSLHLWRAYTNNGQGYSIGLFVDRILREMPPVKIIEKAVKADARLIETPHSDDPFLCRVIYQPAEQRGIISELLDDFIKLLESSPDDFIEEQNEFALSIVTQRVYALFFRCLFIFKDPSFSEEKEWRLVYAKRHLTGHRPDPNDVEKELSFRASGNYFLPFLKVDAGRQIKITDPVDAAPLYKLPFEHIYVGPALDAELARGSIVSYVYRNAYLSSIVHVEASKVTLRSL